MKTALSTMPREKNIMRIEKIHDNLWEIPMTGGMLVPGRVYASEDLLRRIEEDKALDQLVNVAHLPGIRRYAVAMPDIHWGYGFPIGGVAAMDAKEGVISPGGVGYDINCGVRLMSTGLSEDDVRPSLKKLVKSLFRNIPSGPGEGGKIKLSEKDYRGILGKGAAWAVENGWGEEPDLETIEDRGYFPGADPGAVSKRAFERGNDQAGTLGSGNHFLEVNVVDEIYDPGVAEAFRLGHRQVCVLIHSGSRGFGHQICTDYIDAMLGYMRRAGLELPDKQLACACIDSTEGRGYLAAFAAVVKYALVFWQVLMHLARKSFCEGVELTPRELYG